LQLEMQHLFVATPIMQLEIPFVSLVDFLVLVHIQKQ
jgi:hypothetical protein